MRARAIATSVALVLLSTSLVTAGAAASPAPTPHTAKERAYREAHERAILAELTDLLALPNVATDVAAIQRNADAITRLLERRGFGVRRLSAGPGTPPSLFAVLPAPGAKRRVVFYAHFDGQPVTPADWSSDPFRPVLRAGADPTSPDVDLADLARPLDPEWRLFARSASDDKAPIVAMLAALDALRAVGREPSVEVALFLDGEEEQGSPHLRQILAANADALRADLWLLCDGPVHQSRRPQIFFGARGVSSLELTTYGPARPLHSGHYGNWAANPAVSLAHLVASLRDEDGRILVPGFYDDVRPLGDAERRAIDAMPAVEEALRDELALGRTEGGGRLQDRLMAPALNVRGLRSGAVGEEATNSIPTEARASIDFRLVPDQTPERVRERVEAFLRDGGWFVVHEAPDATTRRDHARVIRADWSLDYAGARTDMGLPESRAVAAVLERATGGSLVQVPMLGGSVPMSLFADALHVPLVGVPIVNHDNRQHAANENLRLQNLWDGIEVFAALFAELGGELR
jgi:acetylornithine deacetylase/succinyl-diaminopimelate desuccinylase-like protein